MIGTDSGWMAAAADVLRALNADEPRDALLGRVARHTCELVRVERCSVMLLDDGGERLVVHAGHALTEHYLQDLDAAHPLLVHPADRASDLPAAQAVRERRTVLLPDVTATDTLQPWRELVRSEGIRSVLAVPLGDRDGDDPIAGVLVGYTTSVREFGADELALAELMAQYAATVLKTADLRDAEQRTIADLLRERERREWAEQQDRAMMRLLLDDAGLDDVLAALAGALDASVVLEALDGTVLGRAGTGSPGVPPAAGMRTRRTLARALSTVDAERRAVRLRPARGQRAWVVPVAVADELAARLWVSRPDPGAGTESETEWPDRPVIERFSLLVALELLKRHRAVETELRLTRDLAVELVSGTGRRAQPARPGPRARPRPDPAAHRRAGPRPALRHGGPDAGVIDLDRLGVAGMLLETGTPDGLRRLADRRLGALEEHDRTRAGELVHTLRAWLGTGCSTTATARALHLHPHTVSYRLRRVAALTGTDPRETDGVFELQVALMVRDVQRAAGALARPASSAQ